MCSVWYIPPPSIHFSTSLEDLSQPSKKSGTQQSQKGTLYMLERANIRIQNV
jgi:hypothetical protein